MPQRPTRRGPPRPHELTLRELDAYITALVPKRPKELVKMEAIAREKRFPIIGPACGNICYLVARMTGARRIFELGSGYGYSTAWFARAVRENGGGQVHHTVWDQDLSAQARKHLKVLGLAGLCQFHVSEAVAALKKAKGPFDLIFIDIDKHMYPAALPVIEKKLKPGGVLIADNLLMGGRVLDDGKAARHVAGMLKFTRMIAKSRRWASTIVPIRDGLMVACKP